MRIAFFTHRKLPEGSPDDRLTYPYLERLGIEVVPVCWEDGKIDGFQGGVVRSTWNYVERWSEFTHWLDRLGDFPVWNAPSVLRFSSDKRYLRELEAKGVPIIPTLFSPNLPAAREGALERGWTDIVLKPAISAGAARTFRLKVSEPWPEGEPEAGGWLVQEFLPEIISEGEYSFLFFNGRFSHSVLKRPKSGDYRVQEALGGVITPFSPGSELSAALRVLEAGPPETLYARVDMIRSQGQLLLGELELLEPSLYLAHDSGAPERYARAVAERFGVVSSGH